MHLDCHKLDFHLPITSAVLSHSLTGSSVGLVVVVVNVRQFHTTHLGLTMHTEYPVFSFNPSNSWIVSDIVDTTFWKQIKT